NNFCCTSYLLTLRVHNFSQPRTHGKFSCKLLSPPLYATSCFLDSVLQIPVASGMCLPSLKDHSPELPVVQCLERVGSYILSLFILVYCGWTIHEQKWMEI
uniref:Uncharacterized protein n=1 Tax=Monodon monoceros TaxID=40151 RepID=A0A8C6BTL6_MONMO